MHLNLKSARLIAVCKRTFMRVIYYAISITTLNETAINYSVSVTQSHRVFTFSFSELPESYPEVAKAMKTANL